MARSILKARYTLTPTTTPGVVEIGILPKDFFVAMTKMTFYSMLPSILIVGGLIVVGAYGESKKKPTHTEDLNPEDLD